MIIAPVIDQSTCHLLIGHTDQGSVFSSPDASYRWTRIEITDLLSDYDRFLSWSFWCWWQFRHRNGRFHNTTPLLLIITLDLAHQMPNSES